MHGKRSSTSIKFFNKLSALQHWQRPNPLSVAVWRQCWQGVYKWRQTVCQHWFSGCFRTYKIVYQESTSCFAYIGWSPFICVFPYIHGIELLQSCDSTTAKHVQCRCNTKTVSLQSIYSFIARHVQQYCKVCTATLQHRYNTIILLIKHYYVKEQDLHTFRTASLYLLGSISSPNFGNRF